MNRTEQFRVMAFAQLFTVKLVVLIGITLSIALATWVFSPIKFQADMGILLAFMFIVNMFGALIILPALWYFLLKEKQDAPARDVESLCIAGVLK